MRAASPTGELSPPTPRAKNHGAFIHIERPGVPASTLSTETTLFPREGETLASTVRGLEVPWTLTQKTRSRTIQFPHTRAREPRVSHVGARWRMAGRDRSRHASPAFSAPAVSVVLNRWQGRVPREGWSGDLLSLALKVTGQEGAESLPSSCRSPGLGGGCCSLDIQTVMISFVFRVRSDLLR